MQIVNTAMPGTRIKLFEDQFGFISLFDTSSKILEEKNLLMTSIDLGEGLLEASGFFC